MVDVVGVAENEKFVTTWTQEQILRRYAEALARERAGRIAEGEALVLRGAMSDKNLQEAMRENGGYLLTWDTQYDRARLQLIPAELLRVWKRAVEDNRESQSQECLARMRGYKWLLGHADCDTFCGSLLSRDSAGPWARDSFAVIRAQFESGRFEQMTREAEQRWRAEQAGAKLVARAGLPAAPDGAWRTEYVANLRGFECRVIVGGNAGGSEGGFDLYFAGRMVGNYERLEDAFDACEQELGSADRDGAVVVVEPAGEEVAVELRV